MSTYLSSFNHFYEVLILDKYIKLELQDQLNCLSKYLFLFSSVDDTPKTL